MGGFFVPVVALWAPYQAMRDLVKASSSPRRWELEDTAPSVIIWWILWLIVEFLVVCNFEGSRQSHTVQHLREVSAVSVVIDVFSVPLYLLARHIVRRVGRDQSESYKSRGQ